MMGDYFIERIVSILIQVSMLLVLLFFLFVMGNQFGTLLVIGVWGMLLILGSFLFSYYKIRKRTLELEKKIDSLDQTYLIADLIVPPENLLEKAYYSLLKRSTKAMKEEVAKRKEEEKSYEEFVEEWVHEIKTPLAASNLLLEKLDKPAREEWKRELDAIQWAVEQALFYARSKAVEKDYYIKEVALLDVIHPVLMKHQQTLLASSIQIQCELSTERVYTDPKWIGFVIDQIVVNAIKYRAKENPILRFHAKEENAHLTLYMEDNGQGIKPSDLPRVFDKGFTGSDRTKTHATGFGLFLSRELCRKLGLELAITSQEGKGTTLLLVFPKGKYVLKDALTNL